ncbi:unnamed protein product [Urochloa decumbens]|uniref:Uncharacterized protein n=1 Tax=Urochloa decumbens TaxID=240449 RepID=A0ABC8V863_9POAL
MGRTDIQKRKRSEEHGGRAVKRPAQEQRQHLYLLLDDWERGYSVRKLDVNDFDSFANNTTNLPPPKRGKLFLFLEDRTEYLGDPPTHDSKAPWSWTTINSQLPFYNMQVACYALHPDGRTFFVSAGSSRHDDCPGTFSFDAERLEWTYHGDWLLPFDGQAYFDAELEAWVGFARGKDNAGYLCSCDVPPVAAELTSPPSWKLGMDKMFHKESELHRGAKLVYMGDSKFCLVESLFHKGDQHLCRDDPTKVDLDDNLYPPQRRRVLQMTTFGLKYNKAGNLQIMLRQAHARMVFERPHDFTEPSLEPLAFWI